MTFEEIAYLDLYNCWYYTERITRLVSDSPEDRTCDAHCHYPARWEAVQYQSDKDNAAAIVGLFEAGYGCQIPLSQDVFIKMMLLACGCNCYVHLQCHFLLHLLRHGLIENDLPMLMIDNPRQALVRKVTKGNHK